MTDATTTADPRVESVQRLYAAFGRGDLDAVLAELADDVDWAAEAAGTAAPGGVPAAAGRPSPASSRRSAAAST